MISRTYVEIAEEFFGDAVVVGARVLGVGIARSRYFSAECDVVLIGAVLAVVVTVADLPGQDAVSIVALEVRTAALYVTVTLQMIKSKLIHMNRYQTN